MVGPKLRNDIFPVAYPFSSGICHACESRHCSGVHMFKFLYQTQTYNRWFGGNNQISQSVSKATHDYLWNRKCSIFSY
jgi:hypothetical protein